MPPPALTTSRLCEVADQLQKARQACRDFLELWARDGHRPEFAAIQRLDRHLEMIFGEDLAETTLFRRVDLDD